MRIENIVGSMEIIKESQLDNREELFYSAQKYKLTNRKYIVVLQGCVLQRLNK